MAFQACFTSPWRSCGRSKYLRAEGVNERVLARMPAIRGGRRLGLLHVGHGKGGSASMLAAGVAARAVDVDCARHGKT